MKKNQDFTVVFGGDGTILKTARTITNKSLPVLGVHTGTVGFLTEVTPDKLSQALEKINKGEFEIDRRSMLNAAIYRDGKIIKSIQALNEIVVRNTYVRLIEFTVEVDGKIFDKYKCDGIIIATPTGSTAYNKSAGGHVVAPDKKLFIITPICPYCQNGSSKTVNDNSKILIKIDTDKKVHFAADSQIFVPLQKDDIVKIERSENVLRLIRLK